MPCIYGPYPAGQLRNLSDKRERIDSETPGPRPGERFTADVSDLTAEGAGVARHGGLVVFVPGAVPGDLIRARIAETTGVLSIISFESSFNEQTRSYSCSAEVNTLYGAVSITEVSF